ncbi:MAG: DUF692 domain-containing protein [Chromatiales bacterium]|nr:DUF692 domain-containing protein [Chromatiales bacterium]
MNRPFLGYGLGLRAQHFQHVVDTRPDVDWFEVISENLMVGGGKPKYFLHAIRDHYPMVMHGVSLSIGSTDELDFDYLRALRVLASEIQPEWISDHLCWTGAHGFNSHDLLPLPYTEEALEHVSRRIQAVQDFLGRRLLIENVSSYLTYRQSTMTEWEFIAEVLNRADCLLLLDVNNVYVSARNHGFEPRDYLDALPSERVWQIHLAGHTDNGDHLIDTHDQDVCDSVWSLYRHVIERFGPISTMIERDDNIPEFSELEAELAIARQLAATLEHGPETQAAHEQCHRFA